jgi:hypothetical protein
MTRPFAEASAGSVAAARQCLAAEGHVLVRQAVPRDQVTEAGGAVLAAAARQGLLVRRPAHYEPTRAGAGARHGAALPLWQSEAFHALAHAPALLALAAGILRSDAILPHPRKVLRLVRDADNEALTGWHQDWPEVQGSPRVLTMWLPLAPTTGPYGSPLVAGGRCVAPQPMELADNPVGRMAQVPADRPVHSGPMEPGDVLIFDAFTVHRGGHSGPRSVRLSCDFRYQDAGEPICRNFDQLAGLEYGWDDVYREWQSTALQYYWQRYPLRLIPYSDRLERWRDAEAIRRGRTGDPAARRALELAASASPQEQIAAEARRLLDTHYRQVTQQHRQYR